MQRDPEYARNYCEQINDYVQKGYARKLTEFEVKSLSPKTFYLPHFGVTTRNKPGIRLVFDAAAKIENMSFNDALLCGPDLNKPLLGILMKFRQAQFAVDGDIKEMFHQIRVLSQDEQSQRFLWRDGKTTNPVGVYVMERIIFGANCSPTIAQFVKNYNAELYRAQFPRAVEGIVNRHYVDDYVDSFQDEDGAVQVVDDIIRIHKFGGFELRKIKSNSPKVMLKFGDVEAPDTFNIEGKENGILGMHWSVKSDKFAFVLKLNKVDPRIISCNKRPTKRELLCLTMSIFDPFGFLADFVIIAKLLMQKVWRSGTDWDDEIKHDLYAYWEKWIHEL
ncbi:uncharacterized protein LOC142230899 [Haematobia irritans]|uniref:uncharacterized protein LOC142230899 n=1 Tax=Haematobia irritans TaxID=7368 RepID=UPI003F50A586